MRYFILSLVLISFLFEKINAQKPNVIYIMTDQWRSTAVGYNGNQTVKTPREATMLFDNIADPYQMNNLIGKPGSKKLQDRLERLLHKKLIDIGDENFKPKEYYPMKWGYGFTDKPTVPYNVTPGKISRVYTPKKNKDLSYRDLNQE